MCSVVATRRHAKAIPNTIFVANLRYASSHRSMRIGLYCETNKSGPRARVFIKLYISFIEVQKRDLIRFKVHERFLFYSKK